MSLPASLERLFANYEPGAIDLSRHRDLIVRTVLSRGTWDEIKWLFRHYGRAVVGDIFRKDYHGLRTLPKPTLRLWETLFVENAKPNDDPIDYWRCRRIPPASSPHPNTPPGSGAG